jgi:membrane protein DedA with SNARE-associated domain
MEDFLLHLVRELGYIGLFFATLIESTFVPIPSEVTMIPAGMLAARGELGYWGVLASATAGVLAGSAINYWFGIKFGRALIMQYGKYIFLKANSLKKTERFFAKYGGMAVFIGRLLPGIKHYIAFAAGIACMRFKLFMLCTFIGGLIWIWLLLHVSYVAELKAEQGGMQMSSLPWIIGAIIVISLAAWLVKEKMMKHTDHEHDHDEGDESHGSL